mmetsp:Transcript_39446/g.82644  ORF Transcript_39446/g.82644 Transcript_39446/m.82644 type:complete len:99 (+) Transcript_39446:166-462(+)
MQRSNGRKRTTKRNDHTTSSSHTNKTTRIRYTMFRPSKMITLSTTTIATSTRRSRNATRFADLHRIHERMLSCCDPIGVSRGNNNNNNSSTKESAGRQ